MSQGKPIDERTAAQVAAELQAGVDTRDQIAKRHGIAGSTVSGIKKKCFDDFDRIKNTTTSGERIATLATQLLEQSLVTLIVQLEQCGDKTWLQKQSAGELAVLTGVISDKTVRLLAAAQRAKSDADAEAAAGERPALDGVGPRDVP